MNRAQVTRLDAAFATARQARLAAFERAFDYPLGGDRFRIDHGADYLAFFRGLGEPALYVAEVDGDIAGVLVAVRRALPLPTWYVCDLKIAAAHPGARLGQRLLRAFAAELLPETSRAYGVSMNPARGDNRLATLARRCRAVDVRCGPELLLWSLDLDAWQRAAPVLAAALGPLSFLDPRGTKDIVLASTGRPMPLLHVQHGPFARPALAAPRRDALHMFCLPRGHVLLADLARAGLAPTATATVLHCGMDAFDWTQVLTSDI